MSTCLCTAHTYTVISPQMWAHSCRGGPFHNRFRPFAKLQIVPGHVFATVHTGIHGMFRDTVQHGSFLEAQPEERAATTRWRQRWLAGQNLDYKRILAGKSHPLSLFFSCGELEKYDYRRKLTGFLSGGIISLLLFYRVPCCCWRSGGVQKQRRNEFWEHLCAENFMTWWVL